MPMVVPVVVVAVTVMYGMFVVLSGWDGTQTDRGALSGQQLELGAHAL